MNSLDFLVLTGSILAIAVYGIWRTGHRGELNSYLKGRGQLPWFAIGLSVLATQASAITFLSTPGQGYLGGLSFVQIYFGMPLALTIIAIVFLPIFQRLNVYTAYQYLEKRFDCKTRLLGAILFLLQRGLGAGLTIYAPAIVLTSVFGWSLEITIITCGLVATIYTVAGGSDAVTMTQKYQIAIIAAGMVTAGCLLIGKLPAGISIDETLRLAGGFGKMNAVNFSTNLQERYTFWSGILGGTFLMLSYFGTDQSQVQRYISGNSLRESRLGLLFNAVCKIPMQFCILGLGVLMFVFYLFQPPPLFFDSGSRHYLETHSADARLASYQSDFDTCRMRTRQQLNEWIKARRNGEQAKATTAFASALSSQKESDRIRAAAGREISQRNHGTKANDADYVFITFILNELPHGVIGLLITAFFAAALSSKAAELNALGTSTSIDIYRLIKPQAGDEACLKKARLFTALWGLVAIAFALYARLVENLIQAVNILGSIFYGVMLGLFVVAFLLRHVKGTAIFWGALAAQALVFYLYFNLTISFLWYPLIGCLACVIFSLILQGVSGQPVIKDCAA